MSEHLAMTSGLLSLTARRSSFLASLSPPSARSDKARSSRTLACVPSAGSSSAPLASLTAPPSFMSVIPARHEMRSHQGVHGLVQFEGRGGEVPHVLKLLACPR